MKVIWTLPFFHNPQTGGEKVFNHLADSLEAKGIAVINIYQENKGRRSIAKRIKFGIQNFIRLIKQDKDALVLQNLFIYHEYLIANIFLHTIFKRKIILFINEIYEIDHLSFGRKLYCSFKNYLRFKATSLIVVNSKYTGNWVNNFGDFKKKLYVLYPAIELNIKKSNPPRITEDKPINILCVGNIRKNKGQIYLLQAAQSIQQDFRITFTGLVRDKDYMNKLEEFIIKNNMIEKIKFVGFSNQILLSMEYENADIFVLPTLKEGFGMAIFEAMSFGLPIVACDVGGIGEQVTDGREGFLVPPRESIILKDRILKLMLDKVERMHMGQRAYERAVRMPTWNQTFEDFYFVLQGMAEKGKHKSSVNQEIRKN